MTQQQLNGAHVGSGFEQVGCKTVPTMSLKYIVATIYPSGLCRVTESLCRFGPEIPDRVEESLSESPDIVSCLLQAVQEGEESIAGFVSPWCSIGRGCLGKGFLLHGKCRFEINLCGFNMLVTEPQCDHRTIDACLQKIHGHGVPQAVDGDPFVFQRRAQVGSRHPMLVNKYCTPWTLRRSPLALGNSTCPSPRCGSRNQAFNTASVDLAIGVQRSLRPLPISRT